MTPYNPHKSMPGYFSDLIAIAICLAVAACSSTPVYETTEITEKLKMEPRSIAEQLGLRNCGVSVPLSQAEVIEDAKRIGNPNPEKYSEWINITSSMQSGDQLRLINCFGKFQRKITGDPYYYALIRNKKIILEFHIGFFD